MDLVGLDGNEIGEWGLGAETNAGSTSFKCPKR